MAKKETILSLFLYQLRIEILRQVKDLALQTRSRGNHPQQARQNTNVLPTGQNRLMSYREQVNTDPCQVISRSATVHITS